jgi:hypothetical protein
MVQIRQLAKTTDLQKGNQLLVGQSGTANQYPRKSSIWLLIQYLSTGVFEYLSVRDWFRVPGVPFASLPDPEGLAGARAFCTDADRVPDILLTVGEGANDDRGYSVAASTGSYGSVSYNVFSPFGAVISILAWVDDTPDDLLFFGIEGVYSNAGWNTIIVNGHTFLRTDASYSTAQPFFPGLTVWTWSPATDPFGAEGEVDEIYFGTTGIQFNDPIGGGGSTNVPVFSDGSIWRAG